MKRRAFFQFSFAGTAAAAWPELLGAADHSAIGILDKQSGIELSSSPELAGNFRLELGLPGNRTVTILGREQNLTEATRGSGAITLKWNGPMNDTAGAAHAVAVRMEVQTSGNALEFKLHLDNRTAGKIRSASYPVIGGLAKFGPPGKSRSNPRQPPIGISM